MKVQYFFQYQFLHNWVVVNIVLTTYLKYQPFLKRNPTTGIYIFPVTDLYFPVVDLV